MPKKKSKRKRPQKQSQDGPRLPKTNAHVKYMEYGGVTIVESSFVGGTQAGIYIGPDSNHTAGPADLVIAEPVIGMHIEMEARGDTALAGGPLIGATGEIVHRPPGSRSTRAPKPSKRTWLVPPRRWKGET